MDNQSPRRNFLKKAAAGSIVFSLGSFVGKATKIAGKELLLQPTPIKPDHLIRSIPKNMVYGYYGADVPPVATVKNGDIVEIQTINTAGINKKDPEAFFKQNNMPLDEHARDVIDILKNVQPVLHRIDTRGHHQMSDPNSPRCNDIKNRFSDLIHQMLLS